MQGGGEVCPGWLSQHHNPRPGHRGMVGVEMMHEGVPPGLSSVGQVAWGGLVWVLETWGQQQQDGVWAPVGAGWAPCAASSLLDRDSAGRGFGKREIG